MHSNDQNDLLGMYIKSPSVFMSRKISLKIVKHFRYCSSSVSQSVRMVSCVSNYLQSLITDTAANKPQSATH